MQHLCRVIGNGNELIYAWFEAMHTRVDLMLWDNIGADALLRAAGRIEKETRRIEQLGSRFLPESEVSRINQAAAGQSVKVSEELCALLARCMDYARQWNGLFDITATEGHAGLLCWQRIAIATPYVTRTDSRARIDLSGCLKGYALDRAVELAKQEGIHNGLLNFGNSSIGGLGNHPNGKGWPVADEDNPESIYVLHDECLTTSGNNTETRRHIVHPHSGKMVEGKRTAAVMTHSGMEGEVLSIVRFLSDTQPESHRFADKPAGNGTNNTNLI